ncbi:motile sperm domain-containing protein 1-like isoform X2 [Ischnura elegans]|uniref:motile sperm domain-containing protein 1-like isoform X2 n=1 Tax=Ischnura elegans TaxID=197161 RepID=UPI001ED8BF5E|nr:motile sperm domain-containing protein 1-like isoform X2 [Ischnura elegans]
MKPDCALDGSIPVFVFPSAINFYLEDYSSHKQVLTIYNPYEFPLRFKVLCTDPRKYNVIDPEGCIKRGCCIDIVIRLVAVNPAYLNRVDTFRIQMLDQGSKQILGKRDVLATFFPGGSPESAKHPQAENEDFKSLQGVGSIGSSLPGDRSRQSQHKQGRAVESRSQGSSLYPHPYHLVLAGNQRHLQYSCASPPDSHILQLFCVYIFTCFFGSDHGLKMNKNET